MKQNVSNLDIIFPVILILIINSFEVIFSVSNTKIYKIERHLCKALNHIEFLSENYSNKKKANEVNFTENFIRFKLIEKIFYIFRYLIFIPYLIINLCIKNIIINLKKEKYSFYKKLNYTFIIIILLFGLINNYLCIIRCFLIPTDFQLRKRFNLIHDEDDDSLRLTFNFIYCLCADSISLIIISFICWNYDIYDKYLINEEIKIKTNTEIKKTKQTKENKSQFEKIPEKESTKEKESNTIEIEELDKK